MTNSNPHINYTFADIERYLQEMMSPTERYHLERAALKDPFLADAIEGYEATFLSTAKEHLLAITTQLTSSTQAEEKEYTLANIEKYLQGNMTAAEMHAIEKAALKDPFLADAMEGYEEVDFTNAKEQLHIASDKITGKQEQHTNYNFNDIEQYIEGKMTASESYEIEKTALKEPFLADAIEGYEQTNLTIAKQHLTNIEVAILGEEKEDTKVVAINAASSNKIWMRIAAAVILMFGVGSTIWLVNKKDNTGSGSLAYVKPASISQTPSAALPSNIDSQKSSSTVSNNEKTAIAQQPTIETATPTKSVEAATVSTDAKRLDNVDLKRQNSMAAPSVRIEDVKVIDDNAWAGKVAGLETKDNRSQRELADKKFKADSLKTVVASAASNKQNTSNDFFAKKEAVKSSQASAGQPYYNNSVSELRGRVVNAEGQGLPYATVNLNRNNSRYKSIVSDANGNFNVRANDTAVNATVEVIGYDQQNINLNASRSNTVVLAKRDASLAEEIVTTGLGSKKKQQVETTLGTPIGGLKSFEEYVSKKKQTLKKDSTDEEEYVEALVELEFDVDRLGKPYNISVTNTNTVDTSISGKAIQIVKEGPAWIADKKKKKAKVTIKL